MGKLQLVLSEQMQPLHTDPFLCVDLGLPIWKMEEKSGTDTQE